MSQTSEVFNISPDIQIHYRIDDFTDGWVDAPTVLMLHGIGESTDAFTGWVPHLARLCKVIRVDLRGFGKSSPITLLARLNDDCRNSHLSRRRSW